ncbi:hypothetical protein DFH05DRAFT_1045290 [Lentinula detonsa]|uniref:Uncharacterized protein n=1 Tax=Lentinula detonsa TaxID=2804962 RepID=A0A9W8TZ27_9AGAR|nr:hypothetical protein DFH05DRAFT_1045290 [Lentinula detonsa]
MQDTKSEVHDGHLSTVLIAFNHHPPLFHFGYPRCHEHSPNKPCRCQRLKQKNEARRSSARLSSDEFTDDWTIYLGYKSGFTVVRDCANVPVASPNWPWKVSRLGRKSNESRKSTPISETLIVAEIHCGTWSHVAINVKNHLEKNLPVKGRFSYLDAVMQYLWEQKFIKDITKWNTQVRAMLEIEQSDKYVAGMQKIKDETLEGQQLKLQEAQTQCPDFDFNDYLIFDESE